LVVGVVRVPIVVVSQSAPAKKSIITYFERLRVPIAHTADRGHLVEAIGKLVELLHAVC
jgi:hypothetical protein